MLGESGSQAIAFNRNEHMLLLQEWIYDYPATFSKSTEFSYTKVQDVLTNSTEDDGTVGDLFNFTDVG